MIGFIPELYKDELIYSWLARYMVYSGYTAVSDAYADLYGNKSVSPSVELINNMTEDAVSGLTKYKPLKKLVFEHTMFPEYGRFMEMKKRERLLGDCSTRIGNWGNVFKFPKSNEGRYLKYCPECVREDRDHYGETYWHRQHQIFGIRICTKHKRYLLNSDVSIRYNNTRIKAADIHIEDDNSEVCADECILSLAGYIENVFYDNRYSHNRIGQFLNDHIDNGYIHDNGDRKIYALYDEYRAFYSFLKDEELMTADYMSKLLRGEKSTFYYICQMGLFLGIKSDELLGYKSESDDMRVFRMVAERLNEPIETVEKIGAAVLKEYKNLGGKMYKEIRYRKKIEDDDIKLLKDIKTICAETYGYGDKRPGRVTVKAVARSLGIDPHKMNKMRLCMEEIERYHETQEQYWAREIIWAVGRIQADDNTLTITRIHRYTNIRKEKILSSLRELKVQNEAVYKMVCDVL